MKTTTIILILILLALVGYGGYYWGNKNKTPELSPNEQLVGNDRDEHGCIGSAGYTWCAAKQTCLRLWEEPCETVTMSPTIDERQALVASVRQALAAKHGGSADRFNITVSKVIDTYAQGGVTETGAVGGAMWLAAKSGGTWKLLWDGNGTIPCDTFDAYPAFPTSMVPECWNEATSKNVVR